MVRPGARKIRQGVVSPGADPRKLAENCTDPTNLKPGDWVWSEDHQETCQVVDPQDVWGETLYRVWLPSREVVVRVRAARLRAMSTFDRVSMAAVVYAAAAAWIVDSLAHDTLLAPIDSSVTPLPHQLQALSRAIVGDRIRYLLADEVGLGKTIEAGLIMRELKMRGLVRRTLVVAPKGLVTQWVAEMRTHFSEEFRLIVPSDLSTYRRLDPEENVWRLYNQVVCPMDSVKPLGGRRGWSPADVGAYNRERFDDLVAAGWDLVIVDESHRLGGRTDQVARFRLGEGLAEAAPYLLLLSATPHQGKTDAFHRLMWLLDRAAFPDPDTVTKDRIRAYVIRTEKRQAVDAMGQPLFKPRHTRLVPVAWEDRHTAQHALYERVTEYVRQGYDQALKTKRRHVAFLMLLMQRLVTSSTRAIRAALERRLEVLKVPAAQHRLDVELTGEEWLDLDGQEQVETLLGAMLAGLKSERGEVEALLESARSSEARGADAKAEALLDWIYRFQQEETAPSLKVLVFTEFVATQEMLREFLSERGFSVVCLNGSMDLEQRQRVQEEFAGETRILVSTDAGGEGLNLQFCHVVVNYDIPWNPMRLEQRIGRVDRIGQTHAVRAVNLVLQNTVEHRVREVLEEKLAVILAEFGVDKTSDVLDSADAASLFEDVYASAIVDPGTIPGAVESVLHRVRDQARATTVGAALLTAEESPDLRLARSVADHPLPYWVERMTTAYVTAFGGSAKRRGSAYDLRWPDGTDACGVRFTYREESPGTRVLTLDDPRVRALVSRLPRFAPGQPAPALRIQDLPGGVTGWWSLWRVSATAADWRRERMLPLFLHKDHRVLAPTARHIWERLVTETSFDTGPVEIHPTGAVFEVLRRLAEEHGRPLYSVLVQEHHTRLARERAKATTAFQARRRAIQRIGLAAVRAHRFVELEREEQEWRREIERRESIQPDLTPILVLRIEPNPA